MSENDINDQREICWLYFNVLNGFAAFAKN